MAFAALLLWGGAAWGAAAGPFELFEEEAVVLAAAKHPQKTSRAPASAAVITREDIERYAWRTLGEALQSVPGFLATTDRNYTYLWVRGFGRPGDYNTRVLVLIDGHRINENVYGSVLAGHDFSLDLRSVERIEVVKGPGSALYGDNALFAVVNIVTRSPKASRARLAAEGGSYGTAKGFADGAVAWEDGSRLYGAASARAMAGQDLRYPEFAAVNAGRAGAPADQETSANGYAKLERPGWSVQGGLSTRRKHIPTASYSTLFNDQGSYTDDSRGFFELSGERRVSDELQVTARGYLDHYVYYGDYVYDTASIPATPPPDRTISRDLGRASWAGEELRLRWTRLGERNALTLGQEYEKNLEALQRNHYVPFDFNTTVLDDTRREWRFALFAQQELGLGPSLDLTLGVRWDRYQAFGHSWNPRAALVYRPWAGGAAKLLYGSAFRAPTPYERFYSGAGNGANPALMPEKISTYEGTLEQRLGERAALSASYFQSRMKNLISQVTDPVSNLLVFVNREKIRSDGFELAARGALTPRLSGRLGWTVQSTRQVGGDRLSNSPTHTASAGLSLRLPGEASLSAEALVVGERRSVKPTPLPPTALLNLSAGARPWAAGPRFFAAVYNLADAGYAASGGSEHKQAEIRQDGRSFAAGLEQRFGAR